MNSSESTTQAKPVLSHSHRGDFHLALAFQNVELTPEQYAQTTKLPFEKWDESLKQRFPWANLIVDEVNPSLSLSQDDRMKRPPSAKEEQLMQSAWPYPDVTEEEKLATLRIPWEQLPEDLVNRLLDHAVTPPVDPEEPIIRVVEP